MMRIFLVFFFVASHLQAQVPEGNQLQALLDMDRFHAYTQSWSHAKNGKLPPEVIRHVLEWQPTELAALKLDPKKLSNAHNYDELILQVLNKQRPDFKLKSVDVAWGYNFLKNKLNEAYLVSEPSRAFKPAPVSVIEPGVVRGVDYPTSALNSSEVLLNVDGYVANRTTRAVFWEASQAGRSIELHVGSAADFRDDLTRRGGRILGEVRTQARNYNPIYLVQDPGEKGFHYAITQISGQDRVRHLAMQSSLVRWEAGKGKLAPPPPITVVGDAIELLRREEAELTQVLRVVPKADHVVIGQKGAFERTFGSLAKARAVMDWAAKHPTALAQLSAPHQKLVAKAVAEEADLITHVMKYASDWDKVYEAATPAITKSGMPLAAKSEVFSLDRGSYEMSDYMMTDSKGKTQRWRVFSNSWGDEVLPVARALKNTNHTNVFYMGTAGGLQGSGLKVGDLVVPQGSHDIDGVKRALQSTHMPEGAKKVAMVTHVSSPFEETGAWLQDRKKFAQVVEVETGYLASVFNGPKDRINTMLLVSDMVGVEGETLAEASSSARRKAQIAAISSVIDSAGVTRASVPVGPTSYVAAIEKLLPNRDPAYEYRLVREAQVRALDQQGGNFEAKMKALTTEIKSFTTARVEATLSQVDVNWQILLNRMSEAGIRPQVGIEKAFLEGRWEPSRPLRLSLGVGSAANEAALTALINDLAKADKDFPKKIQVTVTRNATMAKDFLTLAQLPESPQVFMELYKDSALGFGGFGNIETRSGGLKLVRVAPPSDGKIIANLAYFAPDAETRQLLEGITGSKGSSVLSAQIKSMNATATSKEWKIVLQETPKLANGALAQLVPEFKGGMLEIKLYMTPEGMKNPAVVMEELIHLAQITGAGDGTLGKRAFVHPFHWAETVGNARAGSLAAAEKLAAIEVEAAMSVKNTVGTYKEMGLFKSGWFKQIPEANILSYADKRLAHAESLYREVAVKASAERRAQNKAWQQQKTRMAGLEAQSAKLNDLIAKGDRKGVSRLIDAYLPWDLMQPSEKKAWETWLEAIEKPNPAGKKLVFRGLNGDLILRTPEGKPYLMSTLLTKNQGSYTRRLRSISTMREKFGVNSITYRGKVEYLLTGRKDPSALSVMMFNHASEPKGSPFISASHPTVANNFGNEKRAAIMIDERRLIPNGMAVHYVGEQERLIPLIVFPDEVVHYDEVSGKSMDEFVTEVEKKIGRPLTAAERNPADARYFAQAVENNQRLYLAPESLPAASGPTCLSNTSEGLFKTLNSLLAN